MDEVIELNDALVAVVGLPAVAFVVTAFFFFFLTRPLVALPVVFADPQENWGDELELSRLILTLDYELTLI